MTAIAAAVTAVALIAPTAPTDVDPLDVISPGLLIAADQFEDTGTTTTDEHAMLTQRVRVERLESLGTSRTIRERRLEEKHPRHRAVVEAGRQSAADRYAARVARAEAARARRLAEQQRARAAAVVTPSRGAATTTATAVRPATGSITSDYGMRTHPITGVYKLHSGTDFSVGDGNAYAAMAGVVSVSHPAWAGNLVTVDHGGGVQTTYGHLDRITVSDGERVAAGDRVGLIGSRGLATGPHLHFECLINGEYADPIQWLSDRGA